MKKIIIQAAKILDPNSKFNGKTVDISVVNGGIEELGESLAVSDETLVIDGKGQYLAPGFFDLNVNFGEPGLETKEDIYSGCAAAAAGGFTGLALMPATQPPVHSKAEVSFIVNRSMGNLVDVYPLGCISHQREGKELAEMYDMKLAGAIGFTDGTRAIADAGLMSRALLYSRSFNALVFSHPEDANIAGSGKMNEGEVSTYLGMKGNPSLAEELMLARDIYLAEYHDAPVHFSTISSAKSVDLIRSAKKAGLKVTCDVSAFHLVFTDEDVQGFDSLYKLKPPLRSRDDQQALLNGLKDGTIDAIVSQHTPHEVEFKNVEFEIASYGITGLQTVLPLAIKAGLNLELIVEKLSSSPRKILNLPVPCIMPGNTANFVMFDDSENWILDSVTNKSKSANSPFFGEKLIGKVKLVYNNGQHLTF